MQKLIWGISHSLSTQMNVQYSETELNQRRIWSTMKKNSISNLITLSHPMSEETEINYQTKRSDWSWGLYRSIENPIVWVAISRCVENENWSVHDLNWL